MDEQNPFLPRRDGYLPAVKCWHLRRFITAACVTYMTMCKAGSGAEAPTPRKSMSAGVLLVSVEPHRAGMEIQFDEMPFSLNSELVVTTPPWTPHFYVGPTAEAVASARLDRVPAGERLTLEHRGQDAFVGTETLTLSPDGRTLDQQFEGRFLRDGEALIQWRIAALDADLLAGRSARVFSRDPAERQPTSLTMPISPQTEGSPGARVASNFSRVQVSSRVGPIEIEVDSDRPLEIDDYRASKWVAPGAGYFWFGDMGSRIRKDHPARYRVVYRFPPAPSAVAPRRSVSAAAGLSPETEVQTTRWSAPPSLLPSPKEVTWGAGEARIADPFNMAIEGDESLAAAGALRSMITRIVASTPRAPPERAAAVSRVRFIRDPQAASGRPEGYALEVTPDAVTLRAADDKGFLHAVRTLQQLTRLADDGSLRVHAAGIVDWPTLRFRGVHLFTGGRGPELHIKLIRDVLAALKFNHLVLEAEYVRWDAFPEIHHARYGMPKDDVRRILATCRAEQIEVSPLINTLGHCQWMFEAGHHLDLCEDPEARWAYCVTNDATYDFVFKVFEEALELFSPRFLHIGHDEFADRGRVPFRAASKPFSADQLFMRDTLRLHSWLAKRGVRVMMWGDMLLGPEEAPDACNAKSVEQARALREQLPKDVLITDWHYAGVPADRFKNLRTWRDAGHEVVAATWNRPDNIRNFARAAADTDSLGLLQTTWAGYSLDEETFQRELVQYAAYLIAAEAAWNPERAPLIDAATADRRFRQLMGLGPLRPGNARGRTIDLNKVNCYPTAADSDAAWFGQVLRHDLSSIPRGSVWLEGMRFVFSPSREPAVIALHGKLAADVKLPTRVTIELPELRCGRLLIIHATNFRAAPGTVVGRYELEFVDGSSTGIDLRYGQNISAYTDSQAAAETMVVWSGATRAGAPVALAVMPWSLPTPVKPIRRWALQSANAGPTVLLFAATAVNP